MKNTRIIIGGDFNATFDYNHPDDNIDKINMVNIPSRQRSLKIEEICERLNLTDPFRTKYPRKREFTYVPSAWNHDNRSRIDFFLISKPLVGGACDARIYPSLSRSYFDHKTIELNFKKKFTPKTFPIKNTMINNPLMQFAVRAGV